MDKIVLIVGHGSRSEKARENFDEVVKLVREKSNEVPVYGAHMELASPSIDEVMQLVVSKNKILKKVALVPFFLYEGIHIKEDIPEIIEELEKKYEDIQFTFGKPIGAEPVLADILLKRAEAIL